MNNKLHFIPLIFLCIYFLTAGLLQAQTSPQFQVDKTSGCAPLQVNVTNITYSGAASYQLQTNEGTRSISGNDTSLVFNNSDFVLINYYDTNGGSLGSYQVNINVTNVYIGIYGPTYPFLACPGEKLSFNSGGSTAFWTVDNSINFDGNGASASFALGQHAVHATGMANCGTYSIDTVFAVTDTITPIPTLYLSQDTVCPGDPAGMSVNGSYSYILWDFGDGQTDNSGNMYPSHTYKNAGTYTVTVKVTNACGKTGTASMTQVVDGTLFPSKPTLSFTSPACPGAPISFSSNASNSSSYSWYFGNGITSTKEKPTYSFSDTGSQSITLTVKNGCGNSASSTQKLEVKNNLVPVADFYFNEDSACPGQPVHFSANGTYKSYLWYFGDGVTSYVPNPDHAWSGPGSYNISFSVTNYCGNTHDTIQTIKIKNNIPISSIYPSGPGFNASSSICPGDPLSFSAGDPQYYKSAVWKFGDQDSALGFTVYHAYEQTGSFSPSVTMTNYCGLDTIITAQNMVMVGQNLNYSSYPAKSYSINWDNKGTTYCPKEPVFFNTSIPASSYSWDFGDGVVEKDDLPGTKMHIYANSGTYAVKVTATNGCGKDTVVTDSITIGNTTTFLGQVKLSDQTICPGDFYSVLILELKSYSWDYGDGSSPGTADSLSIDGIKVHTLTHQYTNAGTYTFKINEQDYCGNVSSDSATVTVGNTSDKSNLGFNVLSVHDNLQNTCTAVNFFAQGGSSFSWDFGDGDTATTTQPRVVHNYTQKGVYAPSLTVTDGCGKVYTLTTNVLTVDSCTSAIVKAGFTADKNSGQPGLTVNFSDASTALGTTLISWKWDFNNDGIIDATTQNATYTYSSVGVYTVKLIVSDGKISDTLIRTNFITIYDCSKLKANFTSSATCDGTPAILLDSTNVPGGAVFSYKWDIGNNGTIESLNSDSVHYLFSSSGVYPVKLVVSGPLCSDSIVKNVTVQPSVSVIVTAVQSVICETDSLASFTATVNGGGIAHWNVVSGTGTYKDTSNTSAVYRISAADKQAGSFTVRLAGTSPACSANVDTAKVNIARKPIVNVGPNMPLTASPVSINASVSYASKTLWTSSGTGTFNDPSLVDVAYTPSVQDLNDGTVKLTLITLDGACSPVSSRMVLSSKSLICNVQISKTANQNLYTFVANNTDNTTIGAYSWDFGDGHTGSGKVQSDIYNTVGKYIIKLTYSSFDSSCIATAYDSVSVSAIDLPTYSISGTVDVGSNSIDTGRVVLFHFDGYHYNFMRVLSVGSSTNGSYVFSGLDNGYYLIFTLPDTSSTYFKNHIATYYGNAASWEAGKFVQINNADVSGADVTLLSYSYSSYNSGMTQIAGTIVFDTSSVGGAIIRVAAGASDEPVENAVITLYNSSGQRLTSTYTDPFGNYSFDSVGTGDYTVKVEYAGTNMESNLKITADGNSDTLNGNAIVQKQQISVGIKKPQETFAGFRVFPNPTHEFFNIVTTGTNFANLKLKVFSLSGTLMKEWELESVDQTVRFPVIDLQPGFYILNVQSDTGNWSVGFSKY